MEEKYERVCGCCGKKLIYKSNSSYWLANKNNSNCRSCSRKIAVKRCGDLSSLLDDTVEAYYWIGFILADGCFHNLRLTIALSIKDKEHLLKFAKFIKYTGSFYEDDTKISVSVKDVECIQKIMNKFNIVQNKTYNPPMLNINDDVLFRSLIAGFIDGDGNISKQSGGRSDYFLRIKCHSSWENNLRKMNLFISKKDTTIINSQGYAIFNISNTEELKNFKRSIESLDLPLMYRKWDIIDYNFVSKYEKFSNNREQIKELLLLGKSINEIRNIINVCETTIYKIKKECGTIKK